ncbi:hypothetical protein Bhyg_05773 [Pseudolycoriella hygida]|uniref:Uncharacterized protein n=1 Tax=Pseudolycoriella hygida TaxID=35572 RepID=A0A9Q0S276_9DIPT|nr:hypothetical protein Bhyg_05773 [Pseudolycoriella hygida]
MIYRRYFSQSRGSRHQPNPAEPASPLGQLGTRNNYLLVSSAACDRSGTFHLSPIPSNCFTLDRTFWGVDNLKLLKVLLDSFNDIL